MRGANGYFDGGGWEEVWGRACGGGLRVVCCIVIEEENRGFFAVTKMEEMKMKMMTVILRKNRVKNRISF